MKNTTAIHRLYLAVFAMCFGAFALIAAEAPKPNDLPGLLQKGLFEEEVNRNFEAATEAYQQAVAQFDKQRIYGATAIFRLAECQRKLGRTKEAQALYRRVAQEFPDQTNLVQLSQTHLGIAAAPGVAKVENPVPAVVMDEEVQEIRRIETMVKDSPDLINVPKMGATPLHTAAAKGQLKVAEYLLDHGADIECRIEFESAMVAGGGKKGSTPLALAAQAGNKTMVEFLLKRGVNMAAVDSEGKTALHLAAYKGLKAVAQILLDAKAPVNVGDNQKFTPLAWAVNNGHKAMVELLLARGAEVNVVNQNGDTLLHIAAQKGHLELAKMLLAAKADIHKRNNNGETPLFVSVSEHNLPLATLLCEAGAKVDEANSQGFTPLLRALNNKSEEVVDLLLRYHADPNLSFDQSLNFQNSPQFPYQITINKPTPVICALANGLPGVVEKLVKIGAKVNAPDGDGGTPLYWAVYAQQTNVVDFLLRNQANPRLARTDSWRTDSGSTPLHSAVSKGRTDMIPWLLDHGADINARTIDGTTPLLLAAQNRYRDVVALQLERGADATIADRKGTTPLDLVAGPSQPGAYTLPQPSPLLRPGMPPQPGQTAPPPIFTPVQGTSEELKALLSKHGVSILTPRLGMITLCRGNRNQMTSVLKENPNIWNQFTLMEATLEFAQGSVSWPELDKVRVFRREAPGKTKEIPVNMAEIFKGNGKDMALEWGDVVDLPEMDHAASLNTVYWTFSNNEKTNLNQMLLRTVTVEAKGMTNQVQWVPFPPPGYRRMPSALQHPLGSDMGVYSSAWLSRFLNENRDLFLATSDLMRVAVVRTDPKTGKRLEIFVDAHLANGTLPANDLWLRDGDVIKIPEKP